MSQIEYHDPNGIAHFVLPHITSRLPLRNLHWKSPARPVRSISSLHVEFVKATDEASSRASSKDHDSLNTAKGITGQYPARSQRHQIPGLRASPYLKLLLLRCDDKETYKSSSRQLVREWLRDNVSSSPKKDNHDAFEWLVVHVVYPDTAAANEARWSRSSGSGDDAPKQKAAATSRWASKNSSSILEKLKSDFNHSSKTAPDRITQVKLVNQDVTHPESAGSRGDVEDENWSDILAKLKILVLMSFSLRVAQYEEDVRQKDLQRSLPGWNFCTFFILKEGLGLAFENVGLVEDSLAVYDELAAGLDTTLEQQSQAGRQGRGSDFLSHSPDLEQALKAALDPVSSMLSTRVADHRAIGPALKPYRELIVSNNISVFDMKCYVFAKQMALLLRLTSPTSLSAQARDDSNSSETSTMHLDKLQPIGEVEDPLPLAILCRRATEFLTFMGRVMRQEILASAGWASDTTLPAEELEKCTSHLVLSWLFSVARQIIIETASPSFPPLLSSSPAFGAARTDQFPSRRTSLPSSAQNAVSLTTAATIHKDTLQMHPKDGSSVRPLQNVELSNAAAHRAEIYLFQRKILQKAMESCGKENFVPRRDKDTNSVSETHGNNTSETQSENLEKDSNELYRGMTDNQLRESLVSESTSKNLYMILSDHAAWNYLISGHEKSAQRLHADMAILKFNERDYAAAAGYFSRFTSSYANSNWQSIESNLLLMHAQCLKALNRRDEHLRILSSLLAKAVTQQRTTRAPHKLNSKPVSLDLHDVDSLLKEAVAASIELPYDFTIPMMTYFRHLEVENHIRLFEDRDGFAFSVKFRQNLVEKLNVDLVKLQLISEADGSAKDIWLESQEPFELGHDQEEVMLSTKTTALGIYVLAKIVLTCGKIAFTHDFMSKITASASLVKAASRSLNLTPVPNPKHIRCYPRNGSVTARVQNSPLIWIGKQRSLEVILNSGLNDIHSGSISIRASTAGLRLFTKDAARIGGSSKLSPTSKPSTVEFGNLNAGSQIGVVIPWTSEQDVATLSLRVEVEYVTNHGMFHLLSTCDLEVDLSLDVNVQDLFKEAALVSQFLLRPIKTGPIHILSAHLQGSEEYEVVPALKELPRTTTAFFVEPACMTCKVLRKSSPRSSGPSSPPIKLLLRIEYRLVEQDILDQVSALLSRSLKESAFSRYAGLIVPTFTQTLAKIIPRHILENTGLLAQFYLPDLEIFGWHTVIRDLPLPFSEGLDQWLKQWHHDNTSIRLLTPLDPDYLQKTVIQSLMIDFEVPKVDFLHTASVVVNNKNLMATRDNLRPPVIVAGEPLEAEISIRHTRAWSGGTAPKSDEAVGFLYELTADPNIWLIAGQRRALFSATEGEVVTQQVLLMPLMPGYHVLPSVEVKIAATAKHSSLGPTGTTDGTEAPIAVEDLVCETDCTSQADMLLVIEGVASTTVGIGSNHNSGELQASGGSGSMGAITSLLESDAAEVAAA